MKKFRYIAILIIVFVIATEASYAIPSFARQYRLSCQTCHAPVPRLKAYGDEFAGNGFVLTDKESPRYFVETGDSELSLIRDFPVAARFDFNASYNTSNQGSSDFATPYVLKFLTGGSLTTNIAYYFYFFFSERGEVAGVEDAYIMFNNMFGIDLDLYVGQFQLSDPLFKREVRLTFEDYEIYKTHIGLNNANLTYDRGLMLTLGLETGTDIMFELVNGNGIGHADGLKLFDNDKNKNVLGRVSQEVTDFLRVGAFAYYGNQDLRSETLERTSEFFLWGPDASIGIDDILELNLQYVLRQDKDAILAANSTQSIDEVKTQGGFAELIVTPNGDQSKFYAALLFNYIDSDLKELNKKSATVHIGHVARRNIRFFTEYTFNQTEARGDYGTFHIGIVSAF